MNEYIFSHICPIYPSILLVQPGQNPKLKTNQSKSNKNYTQITQYHIFLILLSAHIFGKNDNIFDATETDERRSTNLYTFLI